MPSASSTRCARAVFWLWHSRTFTPRGAISPWTNSHRKNAISWRSWAGKSSRSAWFRPDRRRRSWRKSRAHTDQSAGWSTNRGSPEPENPEAAIEATNLTRSDPIQALGTGHKGHWPLTITNSTLECLGRMQPPPTGEWGFSYFSRKTRPFCPYYDSNNKVSVRCAPRIIRSATVSAAATSAGPGAWDFPDSRRWRASLRPRTGALPFGSGCASVRNVQTDRQDACRYAKHIHAVATQRPFDLIWKPNDQ